MATDKGRTIADYAISKLGCAYIWGGYGEKKCTVSFRKERAKAYPDQKNNIYKNCRVLSGKSDSCAGCQWNGKQAYDCAQLTRYSCKAAGQELVSGANSQWRRTEWAAKGEIGSLPDVEGVLLYHANKSGTMTHTGVYIGGGYAVEARAASYGVVKTKVKDRTWTHWAALPGVLGDVQVEVPKVEQTRTEGDIVMIELSVLKNKSKGEEVKTLQRLLNTMGHTCGSVDGVIGSKTVASIKAFQKSEGLTADGIVGAKTWDALLK